MSADSWSICPNCQKIREIKFKDEKLKLKENYGKISQDEWIKQIRLYELKTQGEDPYDMREDWEIYWKMGKLNFRYSCSCEKCGFQISFTDEKEIEIPGKFLNRKEIE